MIQITTFAIKETENIFIEILTIVGEMKKKTKTLITTWKKLPEYPEKIIKRFPILTNIDIS